MVLNPHKCTEPRLNTLTADSNRSKCTELRSNTLTADSNQDKPSSPTTIHVKLNARPNHRLRTESAQYNTRAVYSVGISCQT